MDPGIMNRNKPEVSGSTLTLRVLAHLLGYPDEALREHLVELREALHHENALSNTRLGEIDALIARLISQSGLSSEAAYVELFDRGRGTSLHLFEHVHGDSRDRGPAMIDLVKTYEEAGLLLEDGELPDYLPVVLQFASTQPSTEARQFLGEIAHIIRLIFSALVRRESPYASVAGALLELAGERAEAVSLPEEQDLDEAWAEPEVFGGCSIDGQASTLGTASAKDPTQPDGTQPLYFIPKPHSTSASSATIPSPSAARRISP
jgi:nitrate reductase delta subunit